jgi:2-polyprenyl-3-methyl-5-hydroxy-6-metoxy-1,4-benzoquinol methylase
MSTNERRCYLIVVRSPARYPPNRKAASGALENREDIRRFKAVATDNVMVGIRTGMTILDISAGTGQFAYEFARS